MPRVFLWVKSRLTLLQPCTVLSTTPRLMESASSFFFLEFWFVHEQILRLLKEVGDFGLWDVVRCLGNWGCSKKFMRYRTSMVRAFGLTDGEHLFCLWFLIVIKDPIYHVFGCKGLSRCGVPGWLVESRVFIEKLIGLFPIVNNWFVPMLI